MPVEFRFTCPLANGIHARPASVLADVVRGFKARVKIARDGAAAVELVSVLSVVGLDIKLNEECVVTGEGEDAAQAIAALTKFVKEKLASVDDVAEAGAAHGKGGGTEATLPVALTKTTRGSRVIISPTLKSPVTTELIPSGKLLVFNTF